MKIAYIRPVFKHSNISPEMVESRIHRQFSELADGKNLLDDIITTLLANGHHITDIMAVLTEFHTQELLEEDPGSEYASFDQQEIDELEPQLLAFTSFGYDKPGLFVPYSKTALKHQKGIKDGNVCIIGEEEYTQELVNRFESIGLKNVNYYIESDLNTLNGNNNAEDTDSVATLTAFIQFWNPDLVIYLPKVFSEQRALEINTACFNLGVDFLPYQIKFPYVRIGPFHQNKETSCYNCYMIRKAGAGNPYADKTPAKDTSYKNFMMFPGFDTISLEMIKYYSKYLDVVTKNNVWVFNLHECKSHTEAAFKLPRCPLCGAQNKKPATKLWETL